MKAFMEYIEEFDQIAKTLNIKALEVKPGYARAEMPLDGGRQCNSVGLAHGGAVFSLADIALALAANAYGVMSLTLNMSINYANPGRKGPLVAEAVETGSSSKISNYKITVKDPDGVLIAECQGQVYKKGGYFPPELEGALKESGAF